MIAVALGLMLVLDHARENTLQRAIELLNAGDARGALAVAEAQTDARARAEARVYVLHQAGDLEGALRAAQSGSDAYPDDAWLAERWSFIATTLRRPREAERAASRLENAAALQPDADAKSWRESARTARADADALLHTHEQRDQAERSARVVSFAAVGSALAALIALAFLPARRQRMSSTPVDASGSSKVEGGSQ